MCVFMKLVTKLHNHRATAGNSRLIVPHTEQSGACTVQSVDYSICLKHLLCSTVGSMSHVKAAAVTVY